jgi:XTP/dITP diphosphohydrolase
LVLATGNQGKVRELIDLLGDEFVVEARPGDLPETVEDGRTLLENATKKAVEVFVHTGSMAMADDTGLFVEALGGKPGVRSARFAGPDSDDAANRTKLLDELAKYGDDPGRRRAYFETVVAIVGSSTTAGALDQDGATDPSITQLAPLVGRGRVHGHIVTSPRGDAGFGYDSVFQPDDGQGRTFAEMGLAAKQAISHRSMALAQARKLLRG